MTIDIYDTGLTYSSLIPKHPGAYYKSRIIPTIDHPAFLLRNKHMKRKLKVRKAMMQ
jgi:hypothetical protein